MAQGRLQATAGIKPDLTTKGERSLLAEPSYGFGADNIFSQTSRRDTDVNSFDAFHVQPDPDGEVKYQ